MVRLYLDNNEALGLLKEAGVRISCFVGVCDGCCEGGNYECVNSTKWFDRVFSLNTNNQYYITDHFDSEPIQDEMFVGNWRFASINVKELPYYEHQMGRTRMYQVERRS